MNKKMGETQVQDPSGNTWVDSKEDEDEVDYVAPPILTRALRRTDPNSQPFVGEGRRPFESDEEEEGAAKK